MAKWFLRIELQTMDFKQCHPVNCQVYRFWEVFDGTFDVFHRTCETFSIEYTSTGIFGEEETSSFALLDQ
jgi:hypothetical protein